MDAHAPKAWAGGGLAWLAVGALFVGTVLLFWPATRFEFVNHDDPGNVIENSWIRGLGAAQLGWMFSAFHMGHYQPLTWLSFAIDYAMWGLQPRGYHLTSVLIHALNAMMVFVLTRMLLMEAGRAGDDTCGGRRGSILGSFFAALFFAVHPLRVESVAWVTERRDVVSGFFFLTTLVTYVLAARAHRDSRVQGYRLWLAMTVVLAGLTVLSKAIGVVLPAVLLVLDVYPLRRLGATVGGWWGGARTGVWVEKLWFVPLSVAGAVIAILGQSRSDALAGIGEYGFLDRVHIVLRGVAFYPIKTLLPIRLAPVYELPPRVPHWNSEFVWSALVIALLGASAWAARSRWPAIPAALCAYVFILSPTSGIFINGPQLYADRYSYLACISLAMLLGGAMATVNRLAGQRRRDWRRIGVTITGVIVILILAWYTREQLPIWCDSFSLWNAQIARYPETSLGYYNRGCLLARAGDLDGSERDLRTTIRLWPAYADAYSNLASVFIAAGRPAEAMELSRQAIAIRPGCAMDYRNLGASLAATGHTKDAQAAYDDAVRLDPNDRRSLKRSAILAISNGNAVAAVERLLRAVELEPTDASAHLLLAESYLMRQLADRALAAADEAIKFAPGSADAWAIRGRSLELLGNPDGARQAFQRALAIQMDNDAARRGLQALETRK